MQWWVNSVVLCGGRGRMQLSILGEGLTVRSGLLGRSAWDIPLDLPPDIPQEMYVFLEESVLCL